jgi:hypothetical protein
MKHAKLLKLSSKIKYARWIVAPVVVGSIPITHPKFFNSFQIVIHDRFGSSVQDGDPVTWGVKRTRVGI